jgi:pimeloyl-ACP methyl ester carboxylesterase
MTEMVAYGAGTLPDGIRSRFVSGVNGLAVHLLEAGFGGPTRPALLLLHGFPELAYSWRKVMLPLAEAGYHVIAPDQRGFGRTGGTDVAYDDDLTPYRLLNYVTDALALVHALGYRAVDGVFGHDYGSPVAAYCALVRPDVFRSVALMSAPFGGPPSLPFDTAAAPAPAGAPTELAAALSSPDLHADLARLARPRKHYQWYYATRPANADMMTCEQGIHDFLRAYFHHKSADWAGNKPFKLAAWTASELEKMPTYYIMDRDCTMAETVAPEMPTAEEIARCRWLPDDELAVYASEYGRNGFQGGLQHYRCSTNRVHTAPLALFSGRAITVPSCFISGTSDWGTYQKPGDFERMQGQACTDMRGVHLVDGAGHWVQQEQPEATTRILLDFLGR